MSIKIKERIQQKRWQISDACFQFIERLYWSNKIHMAADSRVSLAARITVGGNICLGSRVRVFRDAVLNCSSSPFSFSGNPYFEDNGTIQIAEKSSIRSYACLYSYSGSISIGKKCTINPFVVIYGHGGVTIGDDVHIAAQTVIVSANHSFDLLDVPISQQSETRRGIHIESNVWIGSGARILDGVSIGAGTVIASGSVVTKDLPGQVVAAGVPARVIKNR